MYVERCRGEFTVSAVKRPVSPQVAMPRAGTSSNAPPKAGPRRRLRPVRPQYPSATSPSPSPPPPTLPHRSSPDNLSILHEAFADEVAREYKEITHLCLEETKLLPKFKPHISMNSLAVPSTGTNDPLIRPDIVITVDFNGRQLWCWVGEICYTQSCRSALKRVSPHVA